MYNSICPREAPGSLVDKQSHSDACSIFATFLGFQPMFVFLPGTQVPNGEWDIEKKINIYFFIFSFLSPDFHSYL